MPRSSPDAGHVPASRGSTYGDSPVDRPAVSSSRLPRIASGLAAVLEHGRQGERHRSSRSRSPMDRSSLYSTAGGAIVGAGADPRTREVALTFLRTVEASLDRVPIAVDLPLGRRRRMALIALTHGGPRHRAARALDAVAKADDPLHAPSIPGGSSSSRSARSTRRQMEMSASHALRSSEAAARGSRHIPDYRIRRAHRRADGPEVALSR